MPDIKMEENSFKVYYDKLYHQYPEVKLPLFQLPFQRNKVFTGRDDQLKKIDQYLNTQSTLAITSSITSQTQTVVGLGGVGKTQLVVEYAYQAQAKNTYQIIWFLNGHNLDADYLNLAAQLKIYGDNKEEIIEQTKNKLQKLGNYLLVIDDAENYESVKDYLPKTGNNSHVLITTRHKSQWQQLLELGVFELDEALNYFKLLINYSEADHERVIYLLNTLLGRLPLALTQAGAFIKRMGITVEKYIEYFETQIKALWGEEKKPEDYSATIAITWNITLEKIKETHPQAEDLLCGMGFLAPAPNLIKESWLSGIVENSLDRREGLSELVIYSMIDEQTNGYTVHQLLQEVIFGSLPVEKIQHYFEVITEALQKIYPYKDNLKLEDYIQQRSLLPHLEKNLKRADDWIAEIKKSKLPNDFSVALLESIEKKQQHNLLVLIAAGHESLGNVQQQKTFLESALVIDEKYQGAEHLEVAIHLVNLATTYCLLGDALKSKKLLEQALPVFEKHNGSDHPNMAKTLMNLGSAYVALGDALKGKIFLKKTLAFSEKYYGVDHPEIGVILTNLGNAYYLLGNPLKQKKLQEEALRIQEKYYGLHHPVVAKTLVNLGSAYGALGDVTQKKKLLERALNINEKYYGVNHPTVGATLNNLAAAYISLGNSDLAKALLERALVIQENYYGLDHPEVALVLVNLGNVYIALGNVAQKKNLLERALGINEKHYGMDHPVVALALVSLANACITLGDTQQAKILLERALVIQESYYGVNYFEVALTLAGLGNACRNLGDTQKAKELLERALVIQKQHYGSHHFEVAKTSVNLGNACGALGDIHRKKVLLEQALTIKEKHYELNHPEIAVILINLGNVYGSLGDTQQQRVLLECALDINEKYYGLDHQEVARTLVNLSNAYSSLGNAAEAKLLLERALVIQEKYYGLDHSEVALTLVNLGNAYGDLGNAHKKQALQERALIIKERYYGLNHPEVAIALLNLITAYFQLNKFTEAKTAAERAYQILSVHPDAGPKHPHTHIAKQKLDAIKEHFNQAKHLPISIEDSPQNHATREQQILSRKTAYLLYQANKLEKAFDHCITAVRLNEKDTESWHLLAVLSWLLSFTRQTVIDNPFQLAQTCFNNILLQTPTPPIHCEYGLYLLQTNLENKFQMASQQFHSAIHLLQQQANNSMVFYLVDKPRLDSHLQRELQNQKQCQFEILALIHYGLIQCYQGLKDDIAMIEQLDQLTTMAEQQATPSLYRLLSYANEIVGDQANADKLFAQSLELKEDSPTQSMGFSIVNFLQQQGIFAQLGSLETSLNTTASSSQPPKPF